MGPYQSAKAISDIEYRLDPWHMEEGDDDQSELDARLVAEDICWERLKEASQIMTARDKIVAALRGANRALALHEIPVRDVSQTSMSARLREMAKLGIVESVPVVGARYTAWRISNTLPQDHKSERMDTGTGGLIPAASQDF